MGNFLYLIIKCNSRKKAIDGVQEKYIFKAFDPKFLNRFMYDIKRYK